MRPILLSIPVLVVVSCSDSDTERDRMLDVGASDGYAVGFNETCKIRATLIDGHFDNEYYADAYNQGYAEGAADCKKSEYWPPKN